MKQFVRSVAVGAAMVAAAFSAQAQVKIAYVDPLSGLQAAVGEHGLKQFQFSIETLNAKGGVLGGQKLEVVGFDNKGTPQESLVQVQKAIDAGIRYITQGNGSGAAIAISDFISKYNERNPGKEEKYGLARAEAVTRYMALDPDNPGSIYTCLKNARLNARAVRNSITSEMWEIINATWLELNRLSKNMEYEAFIFLTL